LPPNTILIEDIKNQNTAKNAFGKPTSALQELKFYESNFYLYWPTFKVKLRILLTNPEVMKFSYQYLSHLKVCKRKAKMQGKMMK
jgi:hypothetical protein